MKTIDYALKAGRLHQHPVTHWVHHSAEHSEYAKEMIPVYENFCFALTLFRTKTSENILEGKALLERMFAFQTPEGFPVYLHEYPICRMHRLSQKLAPIAHFLLRDFGPVLGETLRAQLQKLNSALHPLPTPQTAEEWADFLIRTQITQEDPSSGFQYWDPVALCYSGSQRQEGSEPEVTLYDIVLGEWTSHFSKRATLDHSIHLQASLIYPANQPITIPTQVKRWGRRFWGTGSPTHSSLLHTTGVAIEEGDVILIDLPSKEVQDEVEVSYFLNRHPQTHLTIKGHKSTTFQLEEPVIVDSEDERFEVIFSLLEGKGRFWGHLHFGNRPAQIGCRGTLKYEAYDWRIALRTIQRTERCLIRVNFRSISKK